MLFNEILKGFEYRGDFLDKADLMDLLDFEIDTKNFDEDFERFDGANWGLMINFLQDGADDAINDLSDSKVDIYNHDLRVWAVDNYDYIEEAVEEYGFDYKTFDFHKLIQLGQFYAYNMEFYTLKNLFLDYLEGVNYGK
jgi:hypothetical protein